MEIILERPMREVPSSDAWIKRELLPEVILHIKGIDTKWDQIIAQAMVKAAVAVFEEYRKGMAE